MIRFTDIGWNDYTNWADDRKVLTRINRMIEEADRDSGVGIGKPERLSGNMAGCLFRRIDLEHRLVYKVIDGDLLALEASRS